MGAPVVHFEINTQNAKSVQDFYAGLFGWSIDANNPMGYGLVRTGVKMGINGGVGPKSEESLPNVVFYAQVENPQACLDKAVSMGGRVVRPVTEIPNMVTYALFADPDGNIMGIVQGPETPPREPKARRAPARKKKATRSRGRKRRARR